MKVWRCLGSIEEPFTDSTVAIGTFDGVHIGHQALLRAACEDARSSNRRFVVFTFDRHPAEVLRPLCAPPLLTSLPIKQRLVAMEGADDLVIARFDEQLRRISPEGFCHLVLSGMLGARSVFVGEGFRFGQDHEGTTEHLAVAQSRYGFRLEVHPQVEVRGERVSSSRIRSLLQGGDVESAALLLGRAYSIGGTVAHGDHLGRKLGFPTANLEIADRLLVPGDGVYAVVARLGDEERGGACSIGTRPTIGGDRRLVEVFLLDFEGDLYGSTMEIEFVERIRDQEKLPDLAALTVKIADDVSRVRAVLAARGSHG